MKVLLPLVLCASMAAYATIEPVFCIAYERNGMAYVHQGGRFQFGLDLSGEVKYDDAGRIERIQSKRISYDHQGRVDRIGSTRVSYDEHGRVERIGSARVRYNDDGSVDRIGSSQVNYWPDRRIKSVRGGLAGLPSDFVPVLAVVSRSVIAFIDIRGHFEFGAEGAGTTFFRSDGRVRSVGGANITFNEQDRVTRVGGTSVTYDDQGRVIRIGGTSVTYDSDGRIRQIGGARIRYDDDGRVRRAGNGVQIVGQGN